MLFRSDIKDDPISKISHEGAPEVCGDDGLGDGADNNCDGKVDETCGPEGGDKGKGGDHNEAPDKTPIKIVERNKDKRSSAALALQLDKDAVKKQVVQAEADLTSLQVLVKAVVTYLYTVDPQGERTQQLVQLQQTIEELTARGRSITAEIDAGETDNLIIQDTRKFLSVSDDVIRSIEDVLAKF